LKLRNAVPPDVEFALVNRPVTRIVPKTRRSSRSRQAEPRALSRFRHLWFDAPELKAMSADGLFNRIAAKFVRRGALSADRANLSPGPELVRQFAARGVSGKRSQPGVCFWLEDKEPNGITSLRSV